MTSEALADIYYNKLKDSNNPGLDLARFFCELNDREVDRERVILFNRLLKLFGRYSIYFAIMDLYGYRDANIDGDVYGLLTYYCKNRLEKESKNSSQSENLDDFLSEVEKQKKAQKKINKTLEIKNLDE
jgi:hypothetical protein